MKKHTDDEDNGILKNGQSVRVSMLAMDSVQRSIHQQSQTDAAVRATEDAMRKQANSEASNHRPGYRLNTRLLNDSAARDALQNVYDEYDKDLCTRHLTPTAGPITSQDNTLLNESFDDCNPYELYDGEIQERYRSK